jgi:nucleoside-diphosphate-sugar epimerase
MNERTVLPLFLSAVIRGDIPHYHGSGSRRQNFVHAEDVAAACLLALTRGHGTYNLGGSGASMRELAELALHVGGRQASEARASGRVDPQEGMTFDMSCERAAKELGFAPQYTLEGGMRALYAAMVSPQPDHHGWQEA